MKSALRELDLSFNPLGNKGIKLIAQGLSSPNCIEKLNLASCKFNFKGGSSVFQMLNRNMKLRELVLDKN